MDQNCSMYENKKPHHLWYFCFQAIIIFLLLFVWCCITRLSYILHTFYNRIWVLFGWLGWLVVYLVSMNFNRLTDAPSFNNRKRAFTTRRLVGSRITYVLSLQCSLFVSFCCVLTVSVRSIFIEQIFTLFQYE